MFIPYLPGFTNPKRLAGLLPSTVCIDPDFCWALFVYDMVLKHNEPTVPSYQAGELFYVSKCQQDPTTAFEIIFTATNYGTFYDTFTSKTMHVPQTSTHQSLIRKHHLTSFPDPFVITCECSPALRITSKIHPTCSFPRNVSAGELHRQVVGGNLPLPPLVSSSTLSRILHQK